MPSEHPKHYALAEGVKKLIVNDLPNIGLDPKMIEKWQLVTTKDIPSETILIVTLDVNVPDPQKYEAATHRIQTILRSRIPWVKVAWVNSTGWRWAIRLSRPQILPKTVDFPGTATGELRLGVQKSGHVHMAWKDYDGHMIVCGITGSGKSNFLRLLAYQAVLNGAQLALSDRQGMTFQMFEGLPNLIAPVAYEPTAIEKLMAMIQGEIKHRHALYQAMPGYPEKLDEYNKAAISKRMETLPRLLVIIDEYPITQDDLGGRRGAFASAIQNAVRVGRKFGINLVLAATDFNKDDLGPMRDQFATVVCFRTKAAETARNLGVAPAGTIPGGYPGRAYTDKWGWMQTYFMDKSDLIKALKASKPVDEDEQKLFDAAQHNGGRVTRSLIMRTLNMQRWDAEKIQASLAQRGWIVKDNQDNNAYKITPRWASTARNLQPLQPPATGLQPGLSSL